jgi:ParB/RepB/Spo0J family partition protein
MTAPAIVSRGKSNGHAPAPIEVQAEAYHAGVVASIPVTAIDVGPNVRTQPGELDDLVESIKAHGVLQPIKVGAAGDRWVVVWGQRRYLAAVQAGLERIPALIDVDEKSAANLATEQLVENLQRADLNPIDEAKALRAILDADPQLTQAELAKRLGRSEPWVSNTLRLLGLAEPVQELIAAGRLGGAHGKVLAGLEKSEQTAIAKEVAKAGGSVRDLDGLIRDHRRQREWNAERAAEGRKRVKQAVEAVIAKKIDPQAQIVVTGYDVGSVPEALQKAGFKRVTSTGYYYGSTPPPSICKCVAFRLEVGYGTPRVLRHCVDDKHRAEMQKRESAKEQRAREAQEARRDAARAAVKAELEAHPLSLGLARHVLWRLEAPGWEKEKDKSARWGRIRALSLEQLHARIGELFYRYDVPPVDVVEEPAEASA